MRIYNANFLFELFHSPESYFIGTFHPKYGPYSKESARYYNTKEGNQYVLENDL